MSQRPEINASTVMMAAVKILTTTHGHDENVWFPSLENRARDAAVEESVLMAWAVAKATMALAPEQPNVKTFVKADRPTYRIASWEPATPGKDPRSLAANDK